MASLSLAKMLEIVERVLLTARSVRYLGASVTSSRMVLGSRSVPESCVIRFISSGENSLIPRTRARTLTASNFCVDCIVFFWV